MKNIIARVSIGVIILFVYANPVAYAQQNPEQSETIKEASPKPLSKYRGSNKRDWDLLHTKLAVSFDWEKRYLFGKATLTLKPYFYEQERLELDAKGMTINRITVGKSPLKYQYDGQKIKISLRELYERADTLVIFIDYTSKPYEREIGGSEAIEEDRGLYFINADGLDPSKPKQIWTQGETEASSVWMPTIDSPNEKCTQEIAITVAENFNSLSNGTLTSSINNNDGNRTDTWVMNQPHSPYLFMMAIGEFEVIKDQWNGLPVSYHLEKGFGQYANSIFGNTPEMMQFFSDKLDYPYPWPKYDQIVVRDYVSGAMENTSASLYMERLNATDRDLIDYNWDDIIAHELFHQWFGDLVTCESWSNLTLNEGFASYAEYLWNEYKYGLDEADYSFLLEQEGYMDDAEKEVKQLIRYHYTTSEDMFDGHTYNKGAAVIHMLRNYLGDEAFFAGLSNYLHTNEYQSVELADLRQAFENVSGEDLNWFFDQWYFFAGHPILDVSDNYENDTLTVTVNQIQSTIHTPIFKLPVFIDIWKGDELFSFPVVIENESETYLFPMTEAPDVVIFDSKRQLLAEINHPKTENQYVAQFDKDKSLYSRIETMDSLYAFKNKKLIAQILNSAFDDPYYVIRQYAIEHLIDNDIKIKKYEEQVFKALQDSSSFVRSVAITYLGNQDFETYQNNITIGLKDQSYMVVGAAIAAYTKNNVALDTALISSFKEESNINIVLTLAAYFNRHPEDTSFDWYNNKLSNLDGNTLFYFIQMYAEKLIQAPTEKRKNAVPKFHQIALNDSDHLVRFSAFQALVLMSEIEGVAAALEEIKNNEKDKRLIELYEKI
jgi:aminopeptidase N